MLVLLLCASSALATDYSVGSTGTFPTVSDALSKASLQPGDRLLISAETFNEDVDIAGLSGVEFVGAGTGTVPTLFQGATGDSVWSITDSSDIVVSDLIIDGNNARRAFSDRGGSTYTLQGITLRNGNVPVSEGGGLFVAQTSTAVVDHVLFDNNRSAFRGGAIYSGGIVAVRGSTFTSNHADTFGGAVFCELSTCSITDSTFMANRAVGRGGAIHTQFNHIDVVRSRFCDNVADGNSESDAAAVAVWLGTGLFLNNVFLHNATTENGGAIYILGSSVDVVNNTFVGNEAIGYGGALYSVGDTADLYLVNNLFQANVGSYSGYLVGAAVNVWSGAFAGSHNLFWDNTTNNSAGLLPLLADPMMVQVQGGCDDNVMLAPGSPAHDAGSPKVLDVDGSPSDIGAFGGPDALRDRDGDGFDDTVEDCDDEDADVNPNATEVCGGVDDDCDTLIDDADTSLDLTTATTFYVDADMDGFGDGAQPLQACVQPDGSAENALDCDDASATSNPAAAEICGDGLDNDCSGVPDDGCEGTTSTALTPGSPDGPAGRSVGDGAAGTVGCACAATPSFPAGASGLALVGLALVGWRRRRAA